MIQFDEHIFSDGLKPPPSVCIYWNYPAHSNSHLFRIIPFLVGNLYKPSFVTVSGWGVDRNIYIYICILYSVYQHRHPSKVELKSLLRQAVEDLDVSQAPNISCLRHGVREKMDGQFQLQE